MATQVFLTTPFDHCTGVHRGTNTAKLNGTASGWVVNGLGPARGLSDWYESVTSVAGPTNGIEIDSGSGVPLEFLSLPIDQNVTISGDITANLWASQASVANVSVNILLQRLDAQGDIVSTIVKSTNTVELTTLSVAQNFSVTPTPTDMLKGDRFRLVVFFDDSAGGNMVAGVTLSFIFSEWSPDTDGDCYITFTETFGWLTTVPTGTRLELTGEDAGSFHNPSLWQMELGTNPRSANGGLVQSSGIGTGAWTTPIQAQGSTGTKAEWYTRRLDAFTLDGLVRFNIYAQESATANNCSLRVELAICDADGTNAVVWGAMSVVGTLVPNGYTSTAYGTYDTGELLTNSNPVSGWLAGPPTAVAAGKKLRWRLYLDDTANAPLTSASLSIWYAVPWSGINGDSWIQLPQTVALAVPQNEEWWGVINNEWYRWSDTIWRAPARRTSALSSVSAVTTTMVTHILSDWGTWTATADGLVQGFDVPQNVVATPTSESTITVTWTMVSPASSYDIERDGVIIATGHPASPYLDIGLTPDILYSYRVRAVRVV